MTAKGAEVGHDLQIAQQAQKQPIREVAQKLGADVGDVQDALEELAESTGQVQCSDVNHDGNHFWKVGGPE